MKLLKKRTIPVVLSVLMALSMYAGVPLAASADTATEISSLLVSGASNVYEITAPGTYHMDSTLTGTVKVKLGSAADRDVTIVGNGTGTANTTVTIECDEDTDLTIQNIYIKNNTTSATDPTHGGYVAPGASLIRFNGEGNELNIEGTCLLESNSYVQNAGIAVNNYTTAQKTADSTLKDTDLVIGGSGTLYMYKYTRGCGIGADAGNANGDITINSTGNIFIKGSKTGSIIGNDTCGVADKEAVMGAIVINSGNISLATMSQGAAIGGSRMSKGNDVTINGGSIFILTDFTGSAVGAGAQLNGTAANNGTLSIGTAASVKAVRTDNSLYSNRGTTQYVNDTLIKDAIANGNDGDELRQCAIPVSGDDVVITENGEEIYNGDNPAIYDFSENTSSTMANWSTTPSYGYVYVYLTPENHAISINGTSHTITWSNGAFTVV